MCWEFNRFFIKDYIKKPLSTVLCSVIKHYGRSWSTQQVVRNTWLCLMCFPLHFVCAQLCSFCSAVSAYNRTEHNQSFFINFIDKNQTPWVVNFQTLAFLHKSSFLHLPCYYREAHHWKNTLQFCIPANFFWVISERFSSWECWDFWRRHDHFRRFPKKSKVFQKRPKSAEGEVIEKTFIHKDRH